MQAVSSFWRPAMEADTLTIVAFGEIYAPLGSGTGLPVATFPVTGGQATIDATNAVRRSLSSVLLVPAPFDRYSLPVPVSGIDALFPDGAELALYKGCLYPSSPAYSGAPMLTLPWLNGGVPTAGEVVSLGRFLMEDVEIYNAPTSGAVTVQLNGSDRAATVTRAQFQAPYSTDGVSTLDVQIRALLSGQVAGLSYNFSPGGGTFPVPAMQTFQVGGDPWAAACQIAASVGYELFFDAFGVCVMRPLIDPTSTAPSMAYEDGASNIVTDVQRSLVNTGVPNLVIVISQGSNVGAPIQSVWWDSNPSSPTFYNSTAPTIGTSSTVPPKMGTYPTTQITDTGSTATTQADNDAAARALFLASHGRFETLDLKIRDNPAQDVEDVISVASADAGIAAGSNYVLDTITIGLDYSTEEELKGRLVVAAS
ncbi:MAG: hypothetical protein KGH75_00140 [Rhodospirillales bacterium]|nr:hypothetical protein [Rhodospirillales bacterium]